MLERQKYLVLYNIRSSYNVGAIFRTADAVGVNKIFLVGVTPCPFDKFKRVSSKISKSALGSELLVAWDYKKTISPLLKKFKKDQIQVIALEQSSNSIDYKKIKLTENWALVLGEETTGLPESILKLCDQVAEIPMAGSKESLNVAVATGVALFEFIK